MSGEYNPSPIGNPSLLKRRSWLETQLVKFIGRHTPKCREVVRILSRSMDEPLPLSMRIKLRIHNLICCWCGRYRAQLRDLRKFSMALPDHLDEAGAELMSAAVKERLKQKLRDRSPE